MNKQPVLSDFSAEIIKKALLERGFNETPMASALRVASAAFKVQKVAGHDADPQQLADIMLELELVFNFYLNLMEETINER